MKPHRLGCRVVLFPEPFTGHLIPMLHLGHALHSKGFSITIIQTRFNALDPARYPGFTFHCIDDPLSSRPGSLNSDPWEMWVRLNTRCPGPFRAALGRVLEQTEEPPIGCLISDPMWEFAASVADEFKLPRMAIRPGGLLAFLAYDSLPLLHRKGYFHLRDTRREEPVQELPPLKVKDLPTTKHQELTKIVQDTKTHSHGFICNTFAELEGSILDRIRANLDKIPVFPVGPLHKYSPSSSSCMPEHDPSCITWLNNQAPNSVLYVSFGSLAEVTKEEFLEIAWGLANSEHNFLWVVRPHMVLGSGDPPFPRDFLEAVGGRGCVVRWAPQEEVLGHDAVGGFWTHCGWNSIMESVSEGVPMICLPFFADQTTNAKVMADVLGVGLLLEKEELRRGEVEVVVRRLMMEEKGRELRERATILKEKARLCLCEGGSSYESLNQLTNHILSFPNAKRMSLT